MESLISAEEKAGEMPFHPIARPERATRAVSRSMVDRALFDNDMTGLIHSLNSLIGTIPYDHWRAENESIFHIIMHLTFKMLGFDMQSEQHSSKGRCDIIVQTPSYIYAMELKLDATARQALDPVLEKEYLQPFKSDKRKKIAIGINFSSEERKVNEYLVWTE